MSAPPRHGDGVVIDAAVAVHSPNPFEVAEFRALKTHTLSVQGARLNAVSLRPHFREVLVARPSPDQVPEVGLHPNARGHRIQIP